jgi:hypothetical protein
MIRWAVKQLVESRSGAGNANNIEGVGALERGADRGRALANHHE